MSEQFDAALRGAYADTAASGVGLDAALPAMVARTRRNRRVRAAGAVVGTAAVVAVVAVAGAALASGRGGDPVPPAQTPTGTVTLLTCGTALADVARYPDEGIRLRAGLDVDEVSAGAVLTGWLGTTVDAGVPADLMARIPTDYGFVVVEDGVVVATTSRVLLGTTGDDETARGATHTATITPRACSDGGALEPGRYELVAFLPATTPDEERRVLVADPVPLTVRAADAAPEPRMPADGASQAAPDDPAVPLPDGEYLGTVVAVDAGIDGGAGTVDADLLVMYTGRAAQEWIDANEPGAELTNDYVVDDPDGPAPRRLPVAADAEVWEWCSGEVGVTSVLRAGGVAEWATAPTAATERPCDAGPALDRGGLYWLDVRDGVVVTVVGQFVP